LIIDYRGWKGPFWPNRPDKGSAQPKSDKGLGKKGFEERERGERSEKILRLYAG